MFIFKRQYSSNNYTSSNQKEIDFFEGCYMQFYSYLLLRRKILLINCIYISILNKKQGHVLHVCIFEHKDLIYEADYQLHINFLWKQQHMSHTYIWTFNENVEFCMYRMPVVINIYITLHIYIYYIIPVLENIAIKHLPTNTSNSVLFQPNSLECNLMLNSSILTNSVRLSFTDTD